MGCQVLLGALWEDLVSWSDDWCCFVHGNGEGDGFWNHFHPSTSRQIFDAIRKDNSNSVVNWENEHALQMLCLRSILTMSVILNVTDTEKLHAEFDLMEPIKGIPNSTKTFNCRRIFIVSSIINTAKVPQTLHSLQHNHMHIYSEINP